MKIEIEVAEEQENETRDRRQLYARAATLVGAFADPQDATDLSAEHDHYLFD